MHIHTSIQTSPVQKVHCIVSKYLLSIVVTSLTGDCTDGPVFITIMSAADYNRITASQSVPVQGSPD